MARIFVDNREIESLSDDHQKLVSLLKRLIEPREKEDFVRKADLLKREIIPLIPLWRGMLSAVAQRASVARQAVKSLSNERAECQTYDNGMARVSLDLRP
jgi:hypothetical protein